MLPKSSCKQQQQHRHRHHHQQQQGLQKSTSTWHTFWNSNCEISENWNYFLKHCKNLCPIDKTQNCVNDAELIQSSLTSQLLCCLCASLRTTKILTVSPIFGWTSLFSAHIHTQTHTRTHARTHAHARAHAHTQFVLCFNIKTWKKEAVWEKGEHPKVEQMKQTIRITVYQELKKKQAFDEFHLFYHKNVNNLCELRNLRNLARKECAKLW